MRTLILFLLVVFLAGCGVADYERRMDQERARIKFLDEENKVLGEVIEIPVRTVKSKNEQGEDVEQVAPAWPFDVFLRLPKGIDKTPPEKVGIHPVGTLTFCRYVVSEAAKAEGGKPLVRSVIVAATPVGVPDEKGKVPPGQWSVEDFRVEVRLGVGSMLKKTLPALKPLRDVRKPVNYKGEAQPPLEFQALLYDFEGPKDAKDAEGKEIDLSMHLAIFLHNKAGRQIGIAFDTSLKNKDLPAFLDTVDRCLKSVDIGEQAAERRERFTRLKQ